MDSTNIDIELRTADLFEGSELEYRDAAGSDPSRLVGLIPFNSLSADLGGFRERLAPGVFTRSLTSNADVRALVNHDPALLLGRTASGTLRLAEEQRGLRVVLDLPNTSYAADLRELVRRRDISGLSFGFKVGENGQRFIQHGGATVRELTNVDLREVSIVAQPAYPDTSLAIRSAAIDPAVRAILEKSSDPSMANRIRQLRIVS